MGHMEPFLRQRERRRAPPHSLFLLSISAEVPNERTIRLLRRDLQKTSHSRENCAVPSPIFGSLLLQKNGIGQNIGIDHENVCHGDKGGYSGQNLRTKFGLVLMKLEKFSDR